VLCWKIINVPFFNTFILSLIVCNTLILATDAYPKPEVDLIGITNQYFTFFFTLEVVLKLTGLTWDNFAKTGFNIFDLVIVILSIVELLISEDSGGVISALRAFRLLRLIKLARSNHTLACLLDSILHTIAAIGNFLVLLGIFIYVFSLLGMSMFAGAFRFTASGEHDKENGEVPRENFDSIEFSIITVFQILVGDRWNEVMYMAIQSSGPASVGYFITLVLIGNFIMLNLFLAILLGNFEQASLLIRGKNEDKILKEFEGKLDPDHSDDEDDFLPADEDLSPSKKQLKLDKPGEEKSADPIRRSKTSGNPRNSFSDIVKTIQGQEAGKWEDPEKIPEENSSEEEKSQRPPKSHGSDKQEQGGGLTLAHDLKTTRFPGTEKRFSTPQPPGSGRAQGHTRSTAHFRRPPELETEKNSASLRLDLGEASVQTVPSKEGKPSLKKSLKDSSFDSSIDLRELVMA